jgi:hypothetical protein
MSGLCAGEGRRSSTGPQLGRKNRALYATPCVCGTPMTPTEPHGPGDRSRRRTVTPGCSRATRSFLVVSFINENKEIKSTSSSLTYHRDMCLGGTPAESKGCRIRRFFYSAGEGEEKEKKEKGKRKKERKLFSLHHFGEPASWLCTTAPGGTAFHFTRVTSFDLGVKAR